MNPTQRFIFWMPYSSRAPASYLELDRFCLPQTLVSLYF